MGRHRLRKTSGQVAIKLMRRVRTNEKFIYLVKYGDDNRVANTIARWKDKGVTIHA